MGANLTLEASQFDAEVLNSDVPVLVDFWATWCGPCLRIAPAVEEIAGELAGQAKVFKVDVDSNGDLAGQFDIMSIPALLVFKGGKEVDRMVGAGSKEDIKALVQKHIG
jgi:thioredoxin 1